MDDLEMRRATAREWMWAKIVLGGGLVIAIAVVAFFALRPVPQPVTDASLAPPATQTEQAPPRAETPQQMAEEDAKAGMMVCAVELLRAKSIGIIPPDGQLSALQPHQTGVKDRLACSAATGASKYVIAADLRCTTVTEGKCLRLFNITSADGTVLYQRQN
jgi:hypothetical protein